MFDHTNINQLRFQRENEEKYVRRTFFYLRSQVRTELCTVQLILRFLQIQWKINLSKTNHMLPIKFKLKLFVKQMQELKLVATFAGKFCY